MEVDGSWSPAEVATFLTEQRVPLRLAVVHPRHGLWQVTLWYQYEDETFQCATSASADVVDFITRDSRVAFDVSTNRPPYRGVRGAGRVEISSDTDKQLLRLLIERYLGDTESNLAQSLLRSDREEVALRITPYRMVTWDYRDRMPARG